MRASRRIERACRSGRCASPRASSATIRPEPADIDALAKAVDAALAPVPFPGPRGARHPGGGGGNGDVAGEPWPSGSRPTTRHGCTGTACPSRPRRSARASGPSRRGRAGAHGRSRPPARGRDFGRGTDFGPDRRAAGATEVRVSDRGIRWGLLQEIHGSWSTRLMEGAAPAIFSACAAGGRRSWPRHWR